MSFSELEARTVVRSVGEFHVSPDGSSSLLHLGLDLGDGAWITLGCASDGQSLQVGSEVLRNYDMEGHGRIEVREFGLPRGVRVREAIPMVDTDGLTFGVLVRTNGRDMFVFNWGDDLYAEQSLPPHVRDACRTPLPD
jgi:hypothetical protein